MKDGDLMQATAWTTTTTWSVEFELVPRPGCETALPIEVRRLKCLLDVLEDRSPVANSDDESLTVLFDSFGDLAEAVQESKEALYSALALAGLPGFTIRNVSIVSHEDFDLHVEGGSEPHYLSVTETARMLGVSKQRVSQMIRERKGLVPDCYIGENPGFRRSTIQKWRAEERQPDSAGCSHLEPGDECQEDTRLLP